MAERQTRSKETEGGFDQWVVRPLQQAQEAWAKSAEWWWQASRSYLPGAGNGSGSDRWMELVDQSFDCVTQVLEAQREMTKTMVALVPLGGDQAQSRTGGKTAAS